MWHNKKISCRYMYNIYNNQLIYKHLYDVYTKQNRERRFMRYLCVYLCIKFIINYQSNNLEYINESIKKHICLHDIYLCLIYKHIFIYYIIFLYSALSKYSNLKYTKNGK